MENLIKIQQELNVPKSLYNSFGKYRYRSCEGILEAVKPLLLKYGCCLHLSDSLKEIAGRVYVEATATLYDKEGAPIASVTAYAQDAGQKTGMDAAQVTGAASSYARKYALNGLFLIDDVKDADTDEYAKQRQTPQASKPANVQPAKPAAVMQNGQTPQDIAREYLRQHPTAFQMLQQREYSHVPDIDSFTSSEMLTIYERLKKVNLV